MLLITQYIYLFIYISNYSPRNLIQGLYSKQKKTSLETPITHLHFNSSWMTNENGISRTARMGATMRSSVSTRRTSKRGTMKVARQNADVILLPKRGTRKWTQRKIPNLTGKREGWDGGKGGREGHLHRQVSMISHRSPQSPTNGFISHRHSPRPLQSPTGGFLK